MFDGATKFFRGKTLDGNWESPFDPFAVGRAYTEATAWQYRYFVPHDVYGMEQLFGGREALIEALDNLYSATSNVRGDLVDIDGLIGQYAHGNEPSHHITHLYNYVGQPWKTQALTRKILKEMYHATPEGITGNEDCGQMSAWYLLNSLGLYAVCPGTNQFSLTSPLFEEATILLANGKQLVVTANNPAENVYIEKVTWNGKAINQTYITYNELMSGGVLDFTLSATPSKKWGTAVEDAPYSYSKNPKVSIPTTTDNLHLFEGEIEVHLLSATKDAQIYYTTDGTKPSASSTKYVAPISCNASMTIQAIAYKEGLEPSQVATIEATKAIYRPALQKDLTTNGVYYRYYEGDFSQTKEMNDAPLVEQGVFTALTIDKAARADYFGYKFSGFIYLPQTGIYAFSLNSDDGSVLFIDGEEVVNNDGTHGSITATGKIPLQKGFHRYALNYFESYEGQTLSWNWCKPGDNAFQEVPMLNLFVK